MKVLVLGGDGMLGHRLVRHLASEHEVAATVRRDAIAGHSGRVASRVYAGVHVADAARQIAILGEFRPDAVVNCIGLVKQRADGAAVMPCLEVNALFPHRLASLCGLAGARLVHFGTDCVYSGARGMYVESDRCDAPDVYGMSKFLGEVAGPGSITLRTSMIGLEIGRTQGLVEWFLAQRGAVHGYRKAVFSGLTTTELSRVVGMVIDRFPDLHGVWHVASEPITKHDLLQALARALPLPATDVIPSDDVICDRSLNGARFEVATGYCAPPWDRMIAELAVEIRTRDVE